VIKSGALVWFLPLFILALDIFYLIGRAVQFYNFFDVDVQVF